jgi:hypothetical protein
MKSALVFSVLLLAGCASLPRPSVTPVLGTYVSEQWGRCGVAGVRVGGSVVVTGHACVLARIPDAAFLGDPAPAPAPAPSPTATIPEELEAPSPDVLSDAGAEE